MQFGQQQQPNYYYPNAPQSMPFQQPGDKSVPQAPYGAPWAPRYPGQTSWQTGGYPPPNNYQESLARANTAMQPGEGSSSDLAEHPVQVPVRVVNPHDLKSERGSGSAGNLRLRLDLNLEVEITLKASIHGDLTLQLL
jgi:hypothetical protein